MEEICVFIDIHKTFALAQMNFMSALYAMINL